MQTMSFIAMVPTYNLDHKCYSKQHPTSKSRQIYALHQDFQEFFFSSESIGRGAIKIPLANGKIFMFFGVRPWVCLISPHSRLKSIKIKT